MTNDDRYNFGILMAQNLLGFREQESRPGYIEKGARVYAPKRVMEKRKDLGFAEETKRYYWIPWENSEQLGEIEGSLPKSIKQAYAHEILMEIQRNAPQYHARKGEASMVLFRGSIYWMPTLKRFDILARIFQQDMEEEEE